MPLTFDDVAAEMRDRFTASQGQPVTITAEEWNALAQAVKVADALEVAHDALPVGHPAKDRAAAVILTVRSGRGHVATA